MCSKNYHTWAECDNTGPHSMKGTWGQTVKEGGTYVARRVERPTLHLAQVMISVP